jgi:hypothetical protein
MDSNTNNQYVDRAISNLGKDGNHLRDVNRDVSDSSIHNSFAYTPESNSLPDVVPSLEIPIGSPPAIYENLTELPLEGEMSESRTTHQSPLSPQEVSHVDLSLVDKVTRAMYELQPEKRSSDRQVSEGSEVDLAMARVGSDKEIQNTIDAEPKTARDSDLKTVAEVAPHKPHFADSPSQNQNTTTLSNQSVEDAPFAESEFVRRQNAKREQLMKAA